MSDERRFLLTVIPGLCAWVIVSSLLIGALTGERVYLAAAIFGALLGGLWDRLVLRRLASGKLTLPLRRRRD